MKDDIKLLVCYHKPFTVLDSSLYLPIHVGRSISKYDMKMQSDDSVGGRECDNISQLNHLYCEMTAMYWAWKNIREIYPHIRYIGLCHYRRYFKSSPNYLNAFLRNVKNRIRGIVKLALNRVVRTVCIDSCSVISSVMDRHFLNDQEILRNTIIKNDILYTKPVRYINCSVAEGFSIIGEKHLLLLNDIVESNYSKYSNTLKKVMKGSKLPAANMIILKVDYLDEYAEFVFGVLEKHISRVKGDGIIKEPFEEKIYDRIPGYLAEILTATYIYYMKDRVKVKELGKYFVKS